MNCQSLLRFVVTSLLGSAAFADIAPDPLGAGVTPQPRGKETSVAMTAEEVDLVLEKKSMGVKVVFHLENQGDATAFEVGFPMNYKDELKDFAVDIDGKSLPPTLKEQQSEPWEGKVVFSYWLVWDMSFAASEKKTVVVTYRVEPYNGYFMIRDGSSSGWDDLLGGEGVRESLSPIKTGYILESGAPWKGPIGKAVVRMKLAGGLTSANLRQVSPAPVERGETTLVWNFESFEPTENIEVVFNDEVTIAEEIELFRQVTREPLEWLEDDITFHLHLADLCRIAGDAKGVLAAYEEVLDRVIAAQTEEMTVDSEIAGTFLEAARAFDGGDRDSAVRCATKAAAFLEEWIPFCRLSQDSWTRHSAVVTARASLVLCLKVLGRSTRDALRVLDLSAWTAGSMDLSPDSADMAMLESEAVEIRVVGPEAEIDATFRVRGLKDGEALVTRGGSMDPVEAMLVDESDGLFDNCRVDIDGKQVSVRGVDQQSVIEYDGSIETRRLIGWKLPLNAGRVTEVRLRYNVRRNITTGWGWAPHDGKPPDEERAFDWQFASYWVTGEFWKGPRRVTVTLTLPKGTGAKCLRRVEPAADPAGESDVRWTLDGVDTSLPKHAGDRLLQAIWKGFDPAGEIAFLRQVLDGKPEGADLVRFLLALCQLRAGATEEGVQVLEELIAAKASPETFGGEGSQQLESGMYERRPLECYILDARRAQKDEAATRKAAERAVTALRAAIAVTNGPREVELTEWREMLECQRILENEEGVKEAEKKVEALGKGPR